jgi:hypothetical protein
MKGLFLIVSFIMLTLISFGQTSQISGSENNCAGSTTEYTYTGSETNCYLYWYVVGGVFPDNFNQASYKVSKNSTNKVKVKWNDDYFGYGYVRIGTGSSSCKLSLIELQVYVANLQLGVSANKTTITQGETVTLSASGAGSSFSWTCDQPTKCGLNTTSGWQVTAKPSVTTTFTCTASGNLAGMNGQLLTCSATKTVKITVNVVPQITGNTICCDQTVCSGDVANTISGNGTLGGGNGTFAYQWQSSTNGTNYSNATGVSNLSSYSPNSLTQTTFYKRIVTSGSATNESSPVVVNVIPSIVNRAAATFSQNATIKATSIINIQGNQTPSNNVIVNFVAGSEIKISPETILNPNIVLRINNCENGGSGMRVATEEKSAKPSELDTDFMVSPNPTDSKTKFWYNITKKSLVKLSLKDEQGKTINILTNKIHEPGEYELLLDTSSLNAGIYFYAFETSSGIKIKKLLVQH